MYSYGEIHIPKNLVGAFIDEVEFNHRLLLEFEEDWVIFSFETEEDEENARKWELANIPYVFIGDGEVYFDKASNSYAFNCYKDNQVKTGFGNYTEAEENLFEYLEEIKVA